jgi:hypothetical protein
MTDGLTGETPGHKVNWFEFASGEFSDIAMFRNIRPMLAQDPPAVVVDLHLPSARPASALEAEVDPADT